MRLAQRGDDADGEAQEAPHQHRSVDQPLERFAAGIGEQQRCSAAPGDKRKRLRGPCTLEIVSQCIFVGKAIEGGGGRALPHRQHGQHHAAATIAVRTHAPAEDAFAILPQDLEIANPIVVELKGCVHSPDSVALAVTLIHAAPRDTAVEQAPEPIKV